MASKFKQIAATVSKVKKLAPKVTKDLRRGIKSKRRQKLFK